MQLVAKENISLLDQKAGNNLPKGLFEVLAAYEKRRPVTIRTHILFPGNAIHLNLRDHDRARLS